MPGTYNSCIVNKEQRAALQLVLLSVSNTLLIWLYALEL